MKNGVLLKFPAKRRLDEDEGKEEENNRERRRRLQNFPPLLSSLPIGLYKEKKRSQRLFLTLGEITKQSPQFSQQSILVPTSFNCSIQSFFSQILFTNNSIVKLHIYPIGFREIYRTNLHKISIDTQTHLINFYYRLHLDLKKTIHNFINSRVLQMQMLFYKDADAKCPYDADVRCKGANAKFIHGGANAHI